jgi:murein DD-endopeptidase MepM/ murein hydrolase activator NlpD
MEQQIQNSSNQDFSNKKQLFILLIVIGCITLGLLAHIQFRPQIRYLETLPTAMVDLEQRETKRDSTLSGIYNLVLDLKTQLNHFPTAPLSIQDMSKVTSTYNTRTDPVTGFRAFHTGVDYRAKMGTVVYAAAAGIVTDAGWDGGYGNTVKIDHENGYVTLYGHLSHMVVVPGQRVNKGDTIGNVGVSGKTTGPHLHYEMAFNDHGKLKKINPSFFTNTVTDSTYSLISQ